MKYKHAYEVIDFRAVDPEKRLFPVAVFRSFPGGVEIVSLNGRGFVVEDGFGFDDDTERGIVSIVTPEGRVTLTELDLQRYHETIEPFVQGLVPDFHDETSLHAFFSALILEK
jgi:hypothetical protein